MIYNKLQAFIRAEYFRRGFQEVKTPILAKQGLWEISGHWDKYRKDMFTLKKDVDDKHEYGISPMNCPKSCIIFKHSSRSYRDLPLRLADCGALHRNENSNSVHNLTRNYCFCQDDAHIFCTPDQIKTELTDALQFLTYVYEKFGFSFTIGLSTRPDNFIGSIDLWDKAEDVLKDTLNDCGFQYIVNVKDGAFYGPKIDIKLTDTSIHHVTNRHRS